jgi:hypothetical protein
MAEYIDGATDIMGGSVTRYTLNTTTPNQAVIRKIIPGPGISITYTGVDSGTGDVTITSTGGSGGSGPMLTLTTVGSSGAAIYNSGTGALNIPNYTLAGLGGATDSSVVHLAGTETITGIKTFNANVTFGSTLRYDSTNASIGIGLASAPTASTFLEIAASTTIKSAIRFNSGVAVTTPASGDLWYASGSLYFYNGTTTIALSNGTITSVNASGTVSGLTLAGSTSSGVVTLTLSGTLSVTPANFANQTQNTFLAAPTTGGSGAPTFRTITSADIPTLNQNTTGSAATLTTPRAIYGNNFDGSAALTQIIASTYGGTGNGFTKFTGPTTTEKTFTLPDASATILTTNVTVTVAQGGTGATTLTGILVGNGTSAVTAIMGTANQLLRRNAGDTAYEFFTPAYISGNQTITLSGDVTGSGTTAITTTLATITQGVGSSFVKITLDTKGRVTGNTAVGSTDITTALGYTPYNATNPSGYITSTGSITGSAGSVTNAITFNTTGGNAAGTTYNGSAARIIDYTTVGAAAASHTHAWSAITSGLPTTISGYGITDAYTKTEVDSFLQGLDPKASVKVATTANITLSGTQTIDGIAVVAGDRVLVKDQTTGSQNGIYVAAAGAWSRATDMDAAIEFPGSFCFVEQGTANQDSAWVCTNDAVTLGTTAITFVKFAGSGAYQAALNGTGYVKMSGTTLNYISSIPITDLAASTISGISLGNSLAALTINNSGTGAASGSTYNGSTAVTISYNSIGAQPLASNLTSLAGLTWSTGTTPFVKMTAANTFTLDTNVYLTANQTITFTPSGDISSTGGANATLLTPVVTTTGLRGVALPTLGASAGFLRYTGTGTNTWVFDTSTYLTSITLTGDVTSTGFATTIASGAVTLAKMANLAANSIIGNNTGAAATPLALTGTQVTAMLDNFTSTTKGLVPLSGGGTTNFLRADGSWAAPAGGGGSSTTISINSGSYTTTYTLAAADAGKITNLAYDGAGTVTIPTVASSSIPVGSYYLFRLTGAGNALFRPASGVTIVGSETGSVTSTTTSLFNLLPTNSMAQLTMVSTDVWQWELLAGAKSSVTRTLSSPWTYTFVQEDLGKKVYITSASNCTVTIPANATTAMPIGTEIEVIQADAGLVNIVGAGGVTLLSPMGTVVLSGTNAVGTLRKTGADVWLFIPAPGVVTFNRQAASYTLVISDAVKIVEMNSTAANTVTVPTNATAAFPIGTQITVTQYGVGTTSFVASAGVTINSSTGSLTINAQFSVATLLKVGTNEWYLFGGISQGTGVQTRILGTNGAQSTSTTLINLGTGTTNVLSFPVVVGKQYYFRFTVNYTSAAGARWGLIGVGTTAATVKYSVTMPTSATAAAAMGTTYLSGLNTATTATTASPTNGNFAIIEGFVTGVTTAGSITVQYASNATGAVVPVAGSLVNYQMIL